MKKYNKVAFLICLIIAITNCSKDATGPGSGTEISFYSYQVINTYPHDSTAFTEGLFFADNFLYESTGLRGQSSLRKVELQTGKVLKIKPLPSQYFGEGITRFQNKIYQLTWQSNTGFIYDFSTFDQLSQFAYPTEGWGITQDGNRLIMSDGSANLYFLNTQNLREERQISVRDDQGPIAMLNELEYIQGQIYANVWQTDRIAIISPDTGNITAWIDLSGLLKPDDCKTVSGVLNGIAYDSTNDRLFVTGKKWCKLFEIKLVPN